MISEVPNLQKKVIPENRFITLIKEEFIKHAKEINKLHKDIDGIEITGGGSQVDLSNYYTKSQTNSAISNAISGINGITDTNTTYQLVKTNSTISLNGSDGSTSTVTDVGTQDEEISTSMIDALFS